MSYVHLHTHTEHSLLDGLLPIKKLVPRIKELGQDAVAITDHGVLSGATEFLRTAEKEKVRPILGVEQYVCEDMEDRTKRRDYHMILIAVTDEGWRNLKFLNSMAHMRGFYYVPRIDLKLLSQNNYGLVGLSGCLGGEVAQAFRDGGYERMKAVALKYKAALRPGHYFLEVQPNGIDLQESLNWNLLRLERDIGVPLCATGDCHYMRQVDAKAQDVLMAIQTRAKVGDGNRLTHGEMNRLYLMSEDEMRAYFEPKGMGHAVDQAASIGRCVDVSVSLGKPKLPRFPLGPGVDPVSYFKGRCERGLEWRLSQRPHLRAKQDQYLARLAHEMSVIVRMDFVGYFLIVADFVSWARDKGIPVGAGRGSGAASMVAYCLKITDLDPLEHGLLFERFLNPERVSMPDFDVDFCEEDRWKVIDYIKSRYGKNSVAQIATFGKMAGKTAIQNVAKVHGLDHRQAMALTAGVPNLVDGHPPTVDWILSKGPGWAEHKDDPGVAEIGELALSIQDAFKTRGVHASGVVIADGDVWETMPVFADKKRPGEMVVQGTMGDAEDNGLIKFDVLGLTTLDVLALCEKYTGVATGDIPLDDPHTYALYARGDTKGVFQMGGDGITRTVKAMSPTKFEHLSALLALYRPGPLEGGMVDSYMNRMHGREPVEYLHPALEDVTKETYGILIYQEQIMSVCRILAGYSLGDADIVRRAMGKKKPEVMAKEKARFMSMCEKEGKCSAEKAGEIWDLLEKFSGYGFNKSHSVGYALISYHTAWYKANHRAAFLAAIASLAQGSADKLGPILHEIRTSQFTILPPDVNKAAYNFTPVDGHTVRAGLRMLKGVGAATVDKILDGRKDGPYSDIWDVAKRGHVPAKVLEVLIKSGACDAILPRCKVGPDRATGLATVPRATAKSTGQRSLFSTREYVQTAPMDKRALLTGEREATGVFLSGHPLDNVWRPLDTVPVSGLTDAEDGTNITLRVMISDYTERQTKSGATMATVMIEDETGEHEVVAFPREWSNNADVIQNSYRKDDPVLVTVGVQAEESDTDEGTVREVKLFLRNVMVLPESSPNTEEDQGPAQCVTITIPDDKSTDDEVNFLIERLKQCPGEMSVVLVMGDEKAELGTLTVGDRVFSVLKELNYPVQRG